MPLAPGTLLGRYEVTSPLGAGGMGEVYLAHDTQLNRRVAIKFPNLSDDEHHAHTRFLREARAISGLSHPNIATVYDYGEDKEGEPFIVMEFVDGEALSHLIHSSALTLSRAVKTVADVADALAEAHRHGIIHRDIKPSNVMVSERGDVKVLDFGLAKHVERQASPIDPEASTMLGTQTKSGVVLGTLLYLSPEQAVGDPVDARSDIFALGALLYECITGHSAFSGKNPIEIVAEVIHFKPPAPSTLNPHVPPELDRITLKAIEKKPDARYQSASDLRADLLAVLHTLEDSSNARTQRIQLGSSPQRRSTLIALSDILRRPRLSALNVLLWLIVPVAIVLGIIEWRRPRLHVPSAEAMRFYETGTNALRMGSFFQASNALQGATAADDQFALAHARLAEAWMELDYSSRAKDELLRVSELTPDRSLFTLVDALYLDAIKATVRRDFGKAVEAYSEIAQRHPDQPQVYVDLGRAFEKDNQSDKALESYRTAISRDSQNAIAFLRLGVLYARRHNLAEATAAFDTAENIHQLLGNVEGRAEVALQRGVMLNDIAGKLAEARKSLEHAREIAGVVNSPYQLIKILFQLSSVSIKEGKTDQAQEYAREAIALGQSNQMENLVARGSIDLGNVYMARGDYTEAEEYFQQGLAVAQRYGGQQNAARARLSLASLYIQRGEPDRGLGYDDEALVFYQSGGYRTETSQALLLRGRALRQKGDYEGALKAFAQAEETGDQVSIALAHDGIGSVLFAQEKHQEALEHFEQSLNRYKAMGFQLYHGYALMNVGATLWRLGRHDEGRAMLTEAARIAKQKGASFSALQSGVDMFEAEIALSEGRFSVAVAKSQQALFLADPEDRVAAVQGKYVLGLAQSLSGRTAAGLRLCEESTEAATRLGDPLLLANSQLALAQAALLAGDTKRALETAQPARSFFGAAALQESEWRAQLVAGLASQKAGQHEDAKLYFASARDRLSSLEQKWGAEVFKSYLARPDIRLYRRQLDQGSSVRVNHHQHLAQ